MCNVLLTYILACHKPFEHCMTSSVDTHVSYCAQIALLDDTRGQCLKPLTADFRSLLCPTVRSLAQLKWNVPEEPGGEMELTYVLQMNPAPAPEEGAAPLLMVRVCRVCAWTGLSQRLSLGQQPCRCQHARSLPCCVPGPISDAT